MKQLILTALILALASVARSDDTGANSPASAASQGSTWSNLPDSLTTSNDQRSQYTGTNQDTLYATNFAMGLPAGTLTAIVVSSEGFGSASQAVRRRTMVSITKDGATIASGSDNVTFNHPQSSDGTTTLSGTTDSLWNISLSVAEANSSTFGLIIWKTASQAGNIDLDHLTITIHFIAAGDGKPGKRRRDMINRMPINITPVIEPEFETWEQIAFNDFFKSQQRMAEGIR